MLVRRIIGVLCCLAIAVWAGSRAVAVRSDTALLIELERQLHKAVSERNLPEIRSLLSGEALYVIDNSGALTADDLLSRVASSGRDYELNEPHELAIRLRGDTAIVAGIVHQRFKQDGFPVDRQVRFMHTWVRNNHSWILLSSHAFQARTSAR